MRQVLAIARYGSFSRAAADLGLSQPALSKSIARLEDELKFKLFDRSGWLPQLTPMGQHLVDQASPLVDEVHRVERHLRLIADGDAGEVRIGLGPALRCRFMPLFAARILEHHPNLRLTLMAGDGIDLLKGVEGGDFDIILVSYRTVEEQQDLVQFDVLDEAAIAIASPTHPLVGKSNISIAEFASFPTTATRVSMRSAPMLYAMPELTDLKIAKRAFEPRLVTNDLATTLEIVRRSLAVYAGPEHVVRPSLDAGEVVRLDVDWSFRYRAVAAMTAGASLSPILRRIVGHAQAIGTALSGFG